MVKNTMIVEDQHTQDMSVVEMARKRYLEAENRLKFGQPTPDALRELDTAYSLYVQARTAPITKTSWLRRIFKSNDE
jgi:hypothetical protein